MNLLRLKSPARVLFLMVVAFAVQGCGRHETGSPLSTAPSPIVPPDFVQITTVSPPAGTRLEARSSASFNVTLLYGLTTDDTGKIVLVLQDALGYRLQQPGEQPTVAVSRGRAEASFSTTLATIPERSVYLWVALVPDDATSTTVTDRVVFPVVASGSQ
jgi:hypothetical protein